MERFIAEALVGEQENLNQDSKIKTWKDPLENVDTKINDLSLADSFFDFESLKEFFDDSSMRRDRISLENIGTSVGETEKGVNMAEEKQTNLGDGSDPTSNVSAVIEAGSDSALREVEPLKADKEKNLHCCIAEEIGKVSLYGIKIETANDELKIDKDGVKTEMLVDGNKKEGDSESESESSDGNKNEGDSESESESSTSSSSSSSSSSSDDDEDDDEEEEEKDDGEKEHGKEKKELTMEVKKESALEEGEIQGNDGTADDQEEEEKEEVTFGGSDVEFDDVGDGDETGAVAVKKPIRSKNEFQVLPPVPEVKASLQPHHQMLPIGVVMSVMGAQVVVKGAEKHNPLSEGSILWITEGRSPLGLIDEIFGPVKDPYYIVRYNSESEIPNGVQAGTPISFVQEFADHVLNDQNLYKKGYDASGENDEEVSDEAEFSDDEKEAEYRRKLKMDKRGMGDQRPGNKKNNNRKKVKNHDGPWRNDIHPTDDEKHNQVPPAPTCFNHNNFPPSSSTVQGFAPSLPMQQSAGFTPTSYAMPAQQQPNTAFPGTQWPMQNYQQQNPYQMPMMNNMPFPQQFDPSQQTNFFGGPAYAVHLPMLMGQSGLNPTMVMGFPGGPAHPSVNAGPNTMNQGMGMAISGQTMEMGFPGGPAHPFVNAEPNIMNQRMGMAISGQPGNPVMNADQNLSFRPPGAYQAGSGGATPFNMGASGRHGRRPYHNYRGHGRFGGWRGRQQYR